MNWKDEWKILLLIGTVRFDNAVLGAFHLVKWYAQEHVNDDSWTGY